MIDMRKLDELIAVGEGYYFETKLKLDKSLVAEAVAFANSSGGTIVLGVDDDGQKVGLQNDNRMISRVQDALNQIQPTLDTRVYKLDNLIVIEIPEGEDKPYAGSSGFYVRIGANSQKLTRNQIIGFFQKEGRVRFDDLVHPRATFPDDFDKEAFEHFLQLSGISSDLDTVAILQNLGCLTDDKQLTNAGVLMFAKSIDFLMNHALVICVLYHGEDKVKIIDKKDLTGNLIENIDQALNFVERNTKTEYVFTGKGPRQEVADYPSKAVREAIVNAVCHRDYFNRGAQTLVEVYSNRLEITNIGGLPSGLAEADFGKKSLARNPLLASLLHRADYMERAGTGISRMKGRVADHSKDLGLEIEYGNFYVIKFVQNYRKLPQNPTQSTTLKPSHNHPTTIPKPAQNQPKTSPKPAQNQPKTSPKPAQEKINLSNTTSKMIGLIKDNPFISVSELEKRLNLSKGGVKHHLSVLMRAGILKRVGGNRGGSLLIDDDRLP